MSDLIFRHDPTTRTVIVLEGARGAPQEIVRLSMQEAAKVYAWLGYVWGGARGVVPPGTRPDEVIAKDPLPKAPIATGPGRAE